MSERISKILITAILSAAASLHAQTMPEGLVTQALQQNPELTFYVASIAAAKGAVRTARMVRNPELNTQAGYKNSRDNSGGPTSEGATWAISFSQTFEYPGRIALRKAIADHDVDLAELRLQQFRLTLAARVRTLAYGIIGAEEKSAAAREVGARFQSLSAVLAQRPVAGVTPELEARIIDANTLLFLRQERDAALAVTTITAELNQLLGRAGNAPLKVISERVQFSAVSLPALLSAARANAFDVRIRQSELAQSGFKVALSKNERYPAIAVGPFYSLENATDREQQVGVGVSLPLPLWDRNAGNIATSKAREQQAQASLLMTEREVERRVTQSAAVLEARRSEIKNWETNAIGKFREAAEMADRNYSLGALSLPIYVETQKQYLEVLSAVTDMQKDALEAAQELEILTGLKLYHGAARP